MRNRADGLFEEFKHRVMIGIDISTEMTFSSSCRLREQYLLYRFRTNHSPTHPYPRQ